MVDLENDELYLDCDLLKRFNTFLSSFVVADGHHLNGHPFTFLPWQWFVWGSIMAWRWRRLGKDGGIAGVRFKQSYIETARGTGKTTAAAMVELFVASECPAAEIMCLANKADQARQAFSSASALARSSTDAVWKVLSNRIENTKTGATIKVQSSKVHTLDGLKCRLYILDETSEARDDYFAKVISALPKLRDAQMVSVTTPGPSMLGKESVYYRTRRIAEKALASPGEFDGIFAYLAGIDEDDSLDDASVWIKAQPSLGHIVPMEDYARAYKEYEASDRLADWERYQMCRYSLRGLDWIGLDEWEKLEGDWITEERVGKCYLGLDLSKSFDLSTLSAVWTDGNTVWLTQWHYIPRPEPGAKHKQYESLLEGWEAMPNVEICEGGIEYDRIEAKIQELRSRFDVVDVGLDALGGLRPTLQRWQNQENIPLLEIPQTIQHIGPATMYFEHLVKHGKLRVHTDAVMKHCLSHVRIITGINGDRRPVKDRSTGVIDAIVSAILAVYTLTYHGGETQSAYTDLDDIAI